MQERRNNVHHRNDSNSHERNKKMQTEHSRTQRGKVDRFRRSEDNHGAAIIYSGRDEVHHSVVSLVMNDETRKCMMKWNSIPDGTISARFFSEYVKMTVIQIYSPTNDASDEDKDTFLELLKKKIDITPLHDLPVLLMPRWVTKELAL